MTKREALRGVEEEVLDSLAQVLTSRQWAELLKAPLECAAGRGNRGLVRKLLGAGAMVGNALHAAARGGRGCVVTDLLESGASVAAKDTSGDTPLHDAAVGGTSQVVQMLLLKGAKIDALNGSKHTPLYLAVKSKKVAIALDLLAAGADVNLRYATYDDTVLHEAVYHGHVEIMRAVLKSGADVDAANLNKSTPLHYASYAALHNRAEAIDTLVQAGANIQARDYLGSTPLHQAANSLRLEALLTLLKHGADVNARDNQQHTPLHWAAVKAGKRGASDVVDSLLRSGADETILNDEGEAAADIVGHKVDAQDQLSDGVDLVRELLGNAPADRAWRRRGYVVLCRAHPDRMHRIHESSGAHASIPRRTRNSATLARTTTSGPVTAGGRVIDGDWAAVVAKVLELREEGVFRTIVGYL